MFPQICIVIPRNLLRDSFNHFPSSLSLDSFCTHDENGDVLSHPCLTPTALNLMVSRQRKDHQAIQFAQVVGGGINPRGLIYNPGNEPELCISVTALSRC